LGGRERKIDAVFVAAPEPIMGLDTKGNNGEGSAKAKKSRRLEGKDELGISPQLLAQLSAEGFDTSGFQAQQGNSCHKRKGLKADSQRDGKKRAIQDDRTANSQRPKISVNKQTKVNVQSRANQRGNVVANHAKENAEVLREGAKPRSMPEASSKKRPIQHQITRSKRQKGSNGQACVKIDATREQDSLPTLPLTKEEECAYADAGYVEWINSCLSKSVVTVVASGLNEGDKASLEALCKESKKSKGAYEIH
jgi:hypothetical protein